jgi:hypothetical protein
MKLDFSKSSVYPMNHLATCLEFLDAYLKPSHGQPTMSEEDTKLAVISIKQAFEQQLRVNMELIERIEKLEEKPKKRFRKK